MGKRETHSESLKTKQPFLEKVAECLWLNTASKTYVAICKVKGKQIKESLETSDASAANRKPRDFRRDLERRDLRGIRQHLRQLTDTFEKTFQHQPPSTIASKIRVPDQIRKRWPGGAARKLMAIRASETAEFLAEYPGKPSDNQAQKVLRTMFDRAKNDGGIARSPVETIRWMKRETPIRPAPTRGEAREPGQ